MVGSGRLVGWRHVGLVGFRAGSGVGQGRAG